MFNQYDADQRDGVMNDMCKVLLPMAALGLVAVFGFLILMAVNQ